MGGKLAVNVASYKLVVDGPDLNENVPHYKG